MGGVRREATQDNILLVAVLYQLERLVCSKSIIDQDLRLCARPSLCLRIENVLNLVETNCYIGVATTRMAIMLTRSRMSCLSTLVRSSRPNN